MLRPKDGIRVQLLVRPRVRVQVTVSFSFRPRAMLSFRAKIRFELGCCYVGLRLVLRLVLRLGLWLVLGLVLGLLLV
jgi:hypothetical protein